MKRKNSFVLTAVLVLLAMAVMPAAAFAEGGVTAELPVETKVEGGFPQKAEVFNLVLTAETPDAPMPEGSVDGVFTFTSTGSEKQIISIDYSKLGRYKYTVVQKSGSNKLCHYDKTVYTVEVYAINSDSSDKPVVNVAINSDRSEDKCKEIVFVNKYDYPPTDKPITGDNGSVLFWLSLMCLSGFGIAASAMKCKQSRTH